MRKNYSIEAIITLVALTVWSPVSFGDGLNRRNSGYSLDQYVETLRHTGRGIVKLPGGGVLLLGGENEQGSLFNDIYGFGERVLIVPLHGGGGLDNTTLYKVELPPGVVPWHIVDEGTVGVPATGPNVVKTEDGRESPIHGQDYNGLFNDIYGFASNNVEIPGGMYSATGARNTSTVRNYIQKQTTLRNNLEEIRRAKDRIEELLRLMMTDPSYADELDPLRKRIKALELENQRLRKTIRALVEAAFEEARRLARSHTRSRGAVVTRVISGEDVVTYTQGDRQVTLNDYHPSSLWYTDSGQNRGGQAEKRQQDPLFYSQNSWGQHTDDQWAIKRVGFKPAESPRSAWHGLSSGQPVTVALIDSGVDPRHPELAGKLWTNQQEIPGNHLDDDHNGYIDDVHGWNFLANNTNLFDYNGHGTVNAGIIAARSDNGIGIKGINPWARIMPLKVLDPLLRGDSAAIGFAILYAVQNGARIINLSIGGASFSYFEQDAIEYAQQKGVLVVVAAGNGGTASELNYPGGLTGVLTVAATNKDNRHATFSNWGQAVDIAAPGVDILSLRAWHTDLLRLLGPDSYVPGSAIVGRYKRYYRVSGTSFATPIVSATASLIMAVQPQLSAIQVTRKILNSADDIGITGWDQFSGYGLLNATRAMTADPEFRVRASLAALTRSSLRGKPAIVVSGTADSSDFDSARLELGEGPKPKSWHNIATPIIEPVNDGPLGVIPATAFSHAGTWTVRLVLQTRHHGNRESRGQLQLN